MCIFRQKKRLRRAPPLQSNDSAFTLAPQGKHCPAGEKFANRGLVFGGSLRKNAFSAAVAGAEIRFSRSPFPNKRKTMSCFRRPGGPPGAGIASGTLWVGRAAAEIARMWVDVGTQIRYPHRPARGTCGLGAPLPTSHACGSMWVRTSTTHIEIDVVTTCGSPNYFPHHMYQPHLPLWVPGSTTYICQCR